VMASFAPSQIRRYFPALQTVAWRLRHRWLMAARNRQPIDLQWDLMHYTVDVITGLAFGQDMNSLNGNNTALHQHLEEIFAGLFRRVYSPLPYWRWLRLPQDHRLDRAVRAVKVSVAQFIAQASARLAHDPERQVQPPNLLEALMVAARSDGSTLNHEDVAGNVLTMLLAGEDTTANTLAWMIYLMQRHPHALRKATEEVRALAPRGLEDFTPELLTAMTYIEACAHETMRLKPVAPYIPAEATRDTVVANIAVPKGTAVWSVLRASSVSEQYFDEPERFLPERWLTGNTPKGVSIPFGSGPRICPGRYLALQEIKLAIGMLLSHFEIERITTPHGQEAREWMSFTMAPQGLRMTLREAGAIST
jgi:cytochrome P450